jgi:DNA-binding protein HU-beta
MADLTKADLVEAIAESADITKADAERALGALIDTVSEALKRGKSVQITGFGTFERRSRSKRKARNPQTGEEITIPATRVPAFKAGKTLRDTVK